MERHFVDQNLNIRRSREPEISETDALNIVKTPQKSKKRIGQVTFDEIRTNDWFHSCFTQNSKHNQCPAQHLAQFDVWQHNYHQEQIEFETKTEKRGDE